MDLYLKIYLGIVGIGFLFQIVGIVREDANLILDGFFIYAGLLLSLIFVLPWK